MIQDRVVVPEAAIADLTAVGFPLLEGVEGDELVKITNAPCGMEGYVKAEHFMPRAYDLYNPYRATRQSTLEFTRGVHFNAVVERYLGRNSLNFADGVIGELMLHAAINNCASIAATAVRIVLDQEPDGHFEAAVWDDGISHEGVQEATEYLHEDEFGDLENPHSKPMGETDAVLGPMAVRAVTTVTALLGGELSLMSAGTKVTVRHDKAAGTYDFTDGKCPVTSGNVIAMKFPSQRW